MFNGGAAATVLESSGAVPIPLRKTRLQKPRQSGRGHVAGQGKNHCFGCGDDNPDGMRLRFHLDQERRQAICHFKLARRYQGPPGHSHGGIIATILDEAMGKVNKLRQVIALTKKMEVEYLKPVPLGKRLTVIGREKRVRGREHTNTAEIQDENGAVLARSQGVFIAVDVATMFAKYLKHSQ